jgi:hypothetical protein
VSVRPNLRPPQPPHRNRRLFPRGRPCGRSCQWSGPHWWSLPEGLVGDQISSQARIPRVWLHGPSRWLRVRPDPRDPRPIRLLSRPAQLVKGLISDHLLPKPVRPGWLPATIGDGAGRGWFGSVRGCPLGTVQDRCEWQASGTAAGGTWRAVATMAHLHRRGWTILGILRQASHA